MHWIKTVIWSGSAWEVKYCTMKSRLFPPRKQCIYFAFKTKLITWFFFDTEYQKYVLQWWEILNIEPFDCSPCFLLSRRRKKIWWKKIHRHISAFCRLPYERHFPIYTFLKMAFSSDGQRIIIKTESNSEWERSNKDCWTNKRWHYKLCVVIHYEPIKYIKSFRDELHPDITKEYTSTSYKLFKLL
jgi:hypothetical protein